MQRLGNFWARISFYLPSGKRTAFMVLWGSFVYFIVVPMYFVLQFYRDPKIDVKRLQFFDNDVNQAQVDVRANSLRMLGFVGVSAVIGLGTTKEKIKITLPCKKWSHLEPFNYRNNLEYIYLKETEGTVDEEVTNQLKLEANIVFHMFFMKFTYNYEKEVDLFNQNKGGKENEETVKVLSMSTKEEKGRLFIKALIELPLPSYLDISLKDLELSLCEDTSGKLCDFVINIESFTKTDLTLILDKQNIFALKRFLFKLDRKDYKSLGNARIFFTSTDNPYASDYHKSLIAILRTFVREIPNRHNQQKIESRNAQNRSVLFDFLSPTSEEKSNILVTKVKVHESLFPINLLAHLCKVIPFENIPVCGKLNEKNILNGSITQLSKFDEEYFTLQINLEVLEGHKLFREFHSLDDKIFELKVIEDGSFASSIFSCISLFYNFKNAPVISSLPDLCMKPSISLSKSKVLENNCLNIYTMASTNDNSFLITNEIYSSTFVEGPISLNFPNDFEFEFCTGLKLRSSKNEISIDPSRPLLNAFSLKEKFKLELEINQEFDLLSFVFFIQNKVESKNKNNKPLTFDDIIENLAFKVLRMYSMSKYELEISTTGKKIINPLIEWDLSIKKTIKINADLNRCENSHVMVKFQKKDNVNTMASCLLEFPNPQFKLQINETGVTIFPETVKNTILICIKFSKVLFFPFKVDFRAVKESDPYSLLISEFLFNKGFKVDNQINKIHKEKTKYAPVTNISLSKFNFINDISYEFDSNKKTANIKGEILCYYNEDPKTNQKMIIEYMKNLRNGTTEQFIKHQPIFSNKEELPIQIKPLEFKYLGSYLKIYGIKLIPVNSNYIKAQKEVVINISFNIDTAKFLEKKCEIKCKYGEEKFSIFYDEDEIKKAIKMFPKKKDNTQPINIVDVISTKNYNCNGKLVNYFSQTNETCIRYRGDKLVYLEKINKCIRRLNLIKYPNAVFLKSYLKFKCDDFTASLKIESDFPTCYDNSIITSNLVIKILNKSSGVDFLDLNRQRFEFMCKLLKTRFYNEHLTYPGRFKILLKSIINGFWSLKGFMVSSCIYIKDYVLRRNKDTESHIVYDGFDKFALKISYTGPEVDYNSKIWYYLPKLSSNCTYDGQTLSSRLKISYGLFLDFLLARNACFTITICVDRTILLQERVAMNISNLGRWWTFRNLVFSF